MADLPHIIESFERLDKWKNCPGAPQRFVYKHNRSRAASNGFPSSLEIGMSQLGLTEHEVAAIFGWTTGDYRFVNPVARRLNKTSKEEEEGEFVEFDDYPFLPNNMSKVVCRLHCSDVWPYVKVLSLALSKLPTLSSKGQRLWRGHRRGLMDSKVGSIIVLKGFTSASRDRDNALDFLFKGINNDDDTSSKKKMTLLVFEENYSGRCISKLSGRREEMEVLFPLDTEFEILAGPLNSADDSEKDKAMLAQANEQLRKKMSGTSEISLIYLKEVKGNDGEF